MLSSHTLTHRLMRPRWCAIAKQVIDEDGERDELKLPDSSVQVFYGLPCGTRSNNSLIHIVLPDGTLPSGTPSRKCARAACDGAEGSLNREPTSACSEQLAAVRVCRQSASVQAGAPSVI
jgi:hypothetical protein